MDVVTEIAVAEFSSVLRMRKRADAKETKLHKSLALLSNAQMSEYWAATEELNQKEQAQ